MLILSGVAPIVPITEHFAPFLNLLNDLAAPLRLTEIKLTSREVIIGDNEFVILIILFLLANLFIDLVILIFILLVIGSHILTVLLVPFLLAVHLIVNYGFILGEGVSGVEEVTFLLKEPSVAHHRVVKNDASLPFLCKCERTIKSSFIALHILH
jgi:hypothetical protein